MAKWGTRVALSLLAALMAALALTAIGTSAGAVNQDGTVNGGLTLQANYTGNANEVYAQVEGCPKGTTVRLLIDGATLGDFTVPDSGRLSVTVKIPAWVTGDVMKAYCFATDGQVFAKIQQLKTDPPPPTNGFDFTDCKFVLPPFTGFNVAGNTFVADQNYGSVALFTSVNPNVFFTFFNVTMGQALVTGNGKPIIKLALCDPQGAPGYTPNGLFVDSWFGPNKRTIVVKVLGCPAGNDVDIFVDGVYNTTAVVPANDILIHRIDTPAGPLPSTVKAICVGQAFGVTTIRPAWNLGLPTNGTTMAFSGGAVTDGGSDDGSPPGGAVVPVVDVEATDTAASAPVPVSVEPELFRLEQLQVLAESGVVAPAATLAADVAAETFRVETFAVPAADIGAPEGVEGLGVRTIDNPAAALIDAGSGSPGLSTSLPTAQLTFGVISAAGLLAFLGLRRVQRQDPLPLA